jgi:D-alanine-D-alanine ligase
VKKRRICLLYGGKSGEHEVSCRSAASVARNLDPRSYEATLVGIDGQGAWHLQEPPRFLSAPYGETLEVSASGELVSVLPGKGLFAGRRPLEVEVVFPVLHGTFGEDGTVQGLLEVAGLPYVGAGVLGSALAMDKEKTKEIWRQAGLSTVDFMTVRSAAPEVLAHIRERFSLPLFVKPAALGSSVGVTKVHDAEKLAPALEEALRYGLKALVEPAVKGREIECAVLGNEEPVAFAPGEILPSHEFYSYQAKYIDPEGAVFRVPAPMAPELQRRIMELAVAAFRAVEGSGMARVDFFLEEQTGAILLSEINTIPGFTNISMYPKMCEVSGLPYPELLARLLELATERFQRRLTLRYAL